MISTKGYISRKEVYQTLILSFPGGASPDDVRSRLIRSRNIKDEKVADSLVSPDSVASCLEALFSTRQALRIRTQESYLYIAIPQE